ncbi:hypothetical protein L208DRAFT_1090516, partial [Tricholoma matsutake]
ILEDKDFSQAIHLHLQGIAKNGYIRAQDIVDFVSTPVMQEKLEATGAKKQSITVRTAQHWLHRMGWRYGRRKNGMYIDGHEHKDVVEYREHFIKRWKGYELRMTTCDNDGNIDKIPAGFHVSDGRFKLILVTHNESTFYENDRRRNHWSYKGDKATPQKKGEGVSLMVSDFLMLEWGRLTDGDEEAQIVFKAGKNWDGYFTADDLIKQVDNMIDIFEGQTNGFATGLWLFDNAPSHQKCADDMLSARKMCKNPNNSWRNRKGGTRMHNATFSDGSTQELYHPDDHPTMTGWFKGMEEIIKER